MLDIQAQDLVRLHDDSDYLEVVEVYDDKESFLYAIENTSSFKEISFRQVDSVYRKAN